jgi:hypothetical protein
MNPHKLGLLLGSVLFAVPAGLAQLAPAPTAPEVKLHISSVANQKQVELSPSEFAALPHITVTVQNSHNNTQETYSGVRVSALLAKLGAPLGSDMRGAAMANYVRATGSDGYKVVFSIAEIDPEFHSGEIIVADQINGQPLDAKAGPFKLVATEDKRPARWVRNLVSLELRPAD